MSRLLSIAALLLLAACKSELSDEAMRQRFDSERPKFDAIARSFDAAKPDDRCPPCLTAAKALEPEAVEVEPQVVYVATRIQRSQRYKTPDRLAYAHGYVYAPQLGPDGKLFLASDRLELVPLEGGWFIFHTR